MLPRVSPNTLLAFLMTQNALSISTTSGTFSRSWLTILREYSHAVTNLQQTERMIRIKEDTKALRNEMANNRSSDWSLPSGLSLPPLMIQEVERGIMIRQDQIVVEHRMIIPPFNQTSVTLKEMGRGKTFVIMPAAVTSLIAGHLPRVPIGRYQFHQMTQIFQSTNLPSCFHLILFF
jgi:hypothetical protein